MSNQLSKVKAQAKLEHEAALKLAIENEKLRAELKGAETTKKRDYSLWRPFGAVVLTTIAVACLLLFNVSYWVRDTVFNTNKFVSTVQPLLKDPEIQKTLQTEITNQLFTQIDLEAELKKALPDNISLIAAPFAGQVKSFTYGKIGQVLNSPQAYQIWTKLLTASHSQIMAYIQNPNNSGVITVNGLYDLAGEELKTTDVGFLFGKHLPNTVGDIQIADIKGVPQARKALNQLQSLTTVLGVVTLVSALLAILVSVKRRRTVIVVSSLMLVMMLSTLLALKIGDTQVGGQVQAQYAAAAEATYRIISKPLAVQTQGAIALLVSFIVVAIVSSSWKYIAWLKSQLRRGLDWISYKVIGDWAKAKWISVISSNKALICWVLVAVSFAGFAFRLPPTVYGAEIALLVSAIVAFVLELFGSVARTAKSKK